MESEGWKDKLRALAQSLTKQEIIFPLALAALGGTAFIILTKLQRPPSLAAQHLQHIQSSIQRTLEERGHPPPALSVSQARQVGEGEVVMVFNLIERLKDKEKSTEQAIRNPFLPPFEKGLFIQDLGHNHRLLFNKFNIYQEHLLVTTRDFEPQSDLLTKEDFKQTVYAFKANRGPYFFNSGPNAGASQKHRHIQIFPREAKSLPIFSSMLDFVHQARPSSDLEVLRYPPFRFAHGLIKLGVAGTFSESEANEQGEDSERTQGKLANLRDRTFDAYLKLVDQVMNNSLEVAYNLVGCESFLLLVPRRKEKAFEEVGVNGVGFMGSVLFKDRELFEKYAERLKVVQILEDITFPARWRP